MSIHSPEVLSLRRVLEAIRRLQTDIPDGVDRSSGSRVRFPVRTTRLMFVAAISAGSFRLRTDSLTCERVYGRVRLEPGGNAGSSAETLRCRHRAWLFLHRSWQRGRMARSATLSGPAPHTARAPVRARGGGPRPRGTRRGFPT